MDDVIVVHGDTARTPAGQGHDGLARPRRRRLGAGDGRWGRSRRRRARSRPTSSKRAWRTSSFERGQVRREGRAGAGADAEGDRGGRLQRHAAARDRHRPGGDRLLRAARHDLSRSARTSRWSRSTRRPARSGPALHRGGRLRAAHQPAAGGRAGARRAGAGHRPGAAGRRSSTTRGPAHDRLADGLRHAARRGSSRCSRPTAR